MGVKLYENTLSVNTPDANLRLNCRDFSARSFPINLVFHYFLTAHAPKIFQKKDAHDQIRASFTTFCRQSMPRYAVFFELVLQQAL